MTFSIKFFEILDKKKNLHIDKCLDYIFNTLDDMCLDGHYELCNEILQTFDVNKYNLDILVGVLTITHYHKKYLSNREDFYNRVESTCNTKILEGLK